jgi:hypothetical protein
LIPVLVCALPAACGAFGADETAPVSGDAGTSDGALPDGALPLDAASPDGAAEPDSAVPCSANRCPGGSSSQCEDDGCNNGVDELLVSGAASLTTGLSDAGTSNCIATAASPDVAFVTRTRTSDGPSTYDVLVRIITRTGGEASVITVAADNGDRLELSMGPTNSTLCVLLNGLTSVCSPAFPTDSVVGARLHIHVGPDGAGKEAVTLAAACTPVSAATLTLPRAFFPAQGDVTFAFGCVKASSSTCSVQFNDMVFSVVPN